jgi:hypothetical protein
MNEYSAGEQSGWFAYNNAFLTLNEAAAAARPTNLNLTCGPSAAAQDAGGAFILTVAQTFYDASAYNDYTLLSRGDTAGGQPGYEMGTAGA